MNLFVTEVRASLAAKDLDPEGWSDAALLVYQGFGFSARDTAEILADLMHRHFQVCQGGPGCRYRGVCGEVATD